MKMLKRILALLAAMMLSASAMAAGDNLVAREGYAGFTDSVYGLCANGDVVWMYGSNGVYTYDVTTGAFQSYVWDSDSRGDLNGTKLDENGLTIHASLIAWYVRNNETHMVLQWYRYNQSRSIRESTAVTEERIVIQNDQASFERIRTLDVSAVSMEDEDFPQLYSNFVIGDTLVMFSPARVGSGEMYFLEADSEKVRAMGVESDVDFVIPWDDGLLFIRNNRGAWSAGKAGIDGKSPKEWHALSEKLYDPGGMVQYADEILYVQDSKLCAVDLNGKAREIANVPFEYVDPASGASAAATASGYYVAGNYEGVVIRAIERNDASNRTLTINSVAGSDLTNAILEYQNVHPDVTVQTVHDSNVLDSLLTGASDWDILILNTEYDSELLNAILNRGWALPFDRESLCGFVLGAIPGISSRLVRNGAVLAVPLTAESYVLGVNVKCLSELNLTIDDIPTNWADLFGFMDSIYQQADVPILWRNGDIQYTRIQWIEAVLNDYDLDIQIGTQENYDTDELRSALNAAYAFDLESILDKSERIDQTDQQYNAMFSTRAVCAIPCGENYTDDYEYIPLPMSVAAGGSAYIPIDCSVAILNPNGKNASLAEDFIEVMLNQMDASTRAVFNPFDAQPVRSEYYEIQTREQDETIASLEEALANAQQSAIQEIQAKLDDARRIRAEMEDWYWEISPNSLAFYQKNADNAILNLPTAGFIESYEVVRGSIQQNEDVETLIRKLQQKLNMRRQEGA